MGNEFCCGSTDLSAERKLPNKGIKAVQGPPKPVLGYWKQRGAGNYIKFLLAHC